MKITVLGCGPSAGVPLIGCDCAVCSSDNPKNTRSRVSLLVEDQGTRLMVDASPDLRQQALTNRFKTIDALFITHDHADHCHGIDDIRSFNYHANQVIPLYADAKTMNALQHRFGYIFKPPLQGSWIRAAVEPYCISHGEKQRIGALETTPFEQDHGYSTSYGLRIGNVAYTTDVKAFPKKSEAFLYGLDVWIVDCLRYNEAPTHAHLDLTLQWIAHYQPKRAILTHMSHEFDYETLRRELPANVEPAYDGMVLTA